MDDEPHLIRAMARRDRSAWATMYDRRVGDLFGFVFHLLGGDRAAAEDVNQEVWLIAIEQLDRFDPARGEFRDWLFGIARHRALRRHRHRSNSEFDDHLDVQSELLAPPEHLEQIERADVVRAALLCLTDDHRQVLLDKYLAGLAVADIAQRSGRSAKAIESLLSRARARLRDLLGHYFSVQTEGHHHEPSDARPS